MIKTILVHHEMILQYVIALFIGGVICFCWLFPMIGEWIKDSAKKFEDENEKMEQEIEEILQRKRYDNKK